MGTWDIGPFDNDMAADFAGTLDETPHDQRVGVVRSALMQAVQAQDYLEGAEGDEAVAAAALVAAQCPGGEPVCTSYGPDEPVPTLPDDLRSLAVAALDRVVAENSELAELWDDTAHGPAWRDSVRRLRAVLDPEPERLEEPLFEV
ncbi:DUF4259 domain-containing protein (plasmid) [Embleya sp. NBC_00888]|uniref:DUF4259 domain-containing protein n=1 Tax=Embleya sp. NBC_00888 TaxID=2975960 RepID=UPI002F91737C|nr:DUF4259 domain-containing protein [Embleya sp. NBC_00888]